MTKIFKFFQSSIISLLTILYKFLIRPFLFLLDSEEIHIFVTKLGENLGNIQLLNKIFEKVFKVEDPTLKQIILGITFSNPIGLAAGFDHNAKLTQILPSFGFGFQAIGSITYGLYEGNPKPRFGRLLKSKSLMVNKGLQSVGATRIISKLKRLKFSIPLGVSVARTNSPDTVLYKKSVQDFIETFRLLKESSLGDYYELNISCPNVFGAEPFYSPIHLNILLTELDKLRLNKPIFIKMPIDLTKQQIDEICKVATHHNVRGLIIGNLTKDRNNPALNSDEVSKYHVGSFSGKPTEDRSNRLIKFVYSRYNKRFVIIGCGGVFNAEDAYKKIKLGASLIQLITGMVYQGPAVIAKINLDLIGLLKRDGYKNINQAVGGGT